MSSPQQIGIPHGERFVLDSNTVTVKDTSVKFEDPQQGGAGNTTAPDGTNEESQQPAAALTPRQAVQAEGNGLDKEPEKLIDLDFEEPPKGHAADGQRARENGSLETVDNGTKPPASGDTERTAAAAEKSSSTDDSPESIGARRASMRSPTPPPPPPKDERYLNRTPNGRSQSRSPAPGQQQADKRAAQASSDTEYTQHFGSEATGGASTDDDSRTEIQSIMEQFDEGHERPGMDEIMSPRLEFAGPMLGSPMIHPPRKSSLEALKPAPAAAQNHSQSQVLHSPPPRTSSLPGADRKSSASEKVPVVERSDSPRPPSLVFKNQPPQPDPEPDLPFDFHRFLEQLRHRTADPVARYVRSFLYEFGKKQWMVHEQVKIISDFLEFISKKMAQCEVWRMVSDAEFDNAREGMEKLVMNRLYTQTFSPAIPPPEPAQSGKGRRKNAQSPHGPGRKGQHQEDVERDEVLAQKIRIYSWVKEEHLDIKPVGEKGKKFLALAQQELLKIRSYRAPRDKVICILNCCKVIFGFLRNAQHDQSADSFVPLLIYVVLQANPEHLVSNVQYILRFRNQDKLCGEAGYYISSLMGAVQFIENLDRTSLTITDADFEKNVEAAVSAIAERHSLEEQQQLQQLKSPTEKARHPSPHLQVAEKSSLARPEVTPRNSLEAERASPRRSTSFRGNWESSGRDDNEENAAVTNLLRTIQRPLSTIGRIFSDADSGEKQPQQQQQQAGLAFTPLLGTTPRLSPALPVQRRSSEDNRRAPSDRRSGDDQRQQQQRGQRERELERQRQLLSTEDAAARQASAEAEEARRIQLQEHTVVVETLAGMFPDLDREVIDDVVRLKEGRVGLAVDACLALSS